MKNRLLNECFKITKTDPVNGGRMTCYVHADRDHETGELVDLRVTPKTRSGTVWEDLMAAVSDRIGKEIRRKA